MINRQLVHFDTAGNRVIINPGEMTNTGGDNWDITPSGYVPWTSATSADVPNTVPLRDADGGFSVGNLQIDTTPPVIQTDGVGKLVWNDTDGTVQFLLKGGNVTMNVGEREVTRVRNADVVPMTPGQVVYLFGSTGSHKEVKLANASAEATSSGTIGVVAEPIAVNQEGYIITTGVLRDINTLALTQGAPVWLSTVTGQMTSTRPNAPNHGVVVGFCVRQHATVGAVYVKVDNGWELDELHNVYISGVANGDLLAYDAANTRWQNLPVASQPWVLKAGDTMTGNLLVSGAKIGVGTASPNVGIHVAGTTATDIIKSDIGYDINPVLPPTTLSGVVLAVAGNVDIGTHRYYVTFVTALGETQFYFGPGNSGVPLTTSAGNQQVRLTIPVSSDYRVTARKLYRTKVGGNYWDAFLLATVADNITTTYDDNIADSALGATTGYYRDNTTAKYFTQNGVGFMLATVQNTAFGYNALSSVLAGIATAGENTAFGAGAGYNITSGAKNIFIGSSAGRGFVGASDAVVIGHSAGYNAASGGSVIIGRNAGYNSANVNNVYVGINCGVGAAGSAGSNNVAVGNSAAYLVSSGSYNICLGRDAGFNLTSGSYNIIIGTWVNPVSNTGSGQLNIGNVIYGINLHQTFPATNTPTTNGKIAIGIQTPTAVLHLKAGTTAATTAPLKFTSGTLMTTAEAGAVEFLTDKAYLTITTGAARKELTLNDTALTAGQAPTVTTNGRLTNSNKFDIYATGTTNGTAGSVVNLNIVPMPTNGELRFLRITVKALSAAAPPDSFGRTLDAMWANAAGVLTQVGADQLGTALTTGNLAAATIATTAAGTNVRVTCTDVTGCGAVVTWQVFGEYY